MGNMVYQKVVQISVEVPVSLLELYDKAILNMKMPFRDRSEAIRTHMRVTVFDVYPELKKRGEIGNG